MPDMNELLKQIASNPNNPQLTEQLRAAFNSPKGQQAAKIISSQQASALEQAAKAAQNGDMSAASHYMSELMQTEQGEKLAQQIKQLFGK